MSGKVNSLARMFAGFPSYRPSAGMLAEAIKTYLEVIEIYTDEQVQEACLRLTRQEREFPPTAGEVRAMCERIVVATIPPRPALTDESRPYVNNLTPEQRAENVRRFKELLAEIGEKNKVDEPPRKITPAPFNMGDRLKRRLIEMGLAKTEPAPALEEDDKPAF